MPVYKEKISGRWFFKVSIKNRQFMRRGFLTKQQARYAEIDFFKKSDYELVINVNFILLCESYLKWSDSLLKKSAHYAKRLIIEKYIMFSFPDVPLKKIIYADFEKWRENLIKYKISIVQKNRIINILKSIFEYASIYYNYSNLDYKKIMIIKNYDIVLPESELKIVSFDEFKNAFKKCDPNFQVVLLLLYFLGLRIGELLGLQVGKSFDGQNGILYIFQAVNNKMGQGKYELVSVKSKCSNRSYVLPYFLKKTLSDHILKNELEEGDFIVFLKDKKKPFSSTSLRRKLKELFGKDFYPHMLRHTNVSELSANDVSLNDISFFEGHSSSDITKKYYLHKTEEKIEKINNVLSQLYEKIMA